MKYLPTAIFPFAFACSAGPASAHLGHAGELAGHSHWIGLGALGIAAGLAAAIALVDRKKRREAESGGQEPEDEENGKAEGEA